MAFDEFLARFSVIVGGFIAPGALWMISLPSAVFSLSSTTSSSDTSPLTSANWAISMPSMLIANRYDASASVGRFGRPPAICQNLQWCGLHKRLLGDGRAAGVLGQAED